MKVNVELEKEDYSYIKETIYNATEKELTDDQVKVIWDSHLPEHIKDDAIRWGLNDTPTRDNIYEWAEENVVAIQFMNIKQ